MSAGIAAVGGPLDLTGTVPARAAASGKALGEKSHSSKAQGETRLVALDGLRGLMTIMVLVSHYFAEVAHGWHAFAVGWVAVLTFFTLSGFLVGRLILDKMDRANFFTVFYVRRFCRTLPVYVFCVVLVFGCIRYFDGAPWLDLNHAFPLWSYLTFTQNFFMISTDSIGPHWLAPTWTLTVEEHFYLLAPALFILTPRRHLLKALVAGALLSVAFRAWVFYTGQMPVMAALVMLPGNADALFCGLIAGVVYKENRVSWRHYDLALRIAPLAALIGAIVLKLIDGRTGHLLDVFGMFLVSAGSAAFILAIVRGAPEGKRLHHKAFVFCGNNSYSIYLTHLMVVGLAHGLVLGAVPDVQTPVQILVTIAAIPVALIIGRVFTRFVEEPITAYGRSWRWSDERRVLKSQIAVSPATA